jgi:hypothetical protein
MSPAQPAIPQTVRDDAKYKRLQAIIERQTSEGRSKQYTEALLKAHAYLNNRDVVTGDDLQILDLFAPYLMIDYWLSEREEIAMPLRFQPNSYILLFYLIENGVARRKVIATKFQVSLATITKSVIPLREKNIVIGTYGTDTYQLNPEWYKRYIMPIIEFGQQIGVVKL